MENVTTCFSLNWEQLGYIPVVYAKSSYHTTVSIVFADNRIQSNIHLFHSLTFGNRQTVLDVDSPNNLKEVNLYPEIPAASFILLDLYTYWTILFGPISCYNAASWPSFYLCFARCFRLNAVCVAFLTLRLSNNTFHETSNETLKQINGMRREARMARTPSN